MAVLVNARPSCTRAKACIRSRTLTLPAGSLMPSALVPQGIDTFWRHSRGCCGRCTKTSRWPLLRLATLIITSIRVLYAGRVPCQCQYPPASRTRIEEMRLLKDDGEKNCAAANIHDCRDSRRCSTCKRRRGYRYTNDC